MRSTAIAVGTAVLLFAVALLSPSVADTADAATIRVDHAGGGDYTAIQPAIDAAQDGDTILIAPGTYTGADNRNLTFGLNENLVIEAESGFPTVTIDCQGQGRAFDLFRTGQDTTTVIRGLVIQNGYTNDYDGGGIRVNGYTRETHLVIEDCLIKDCSAAHNGGGIHVGYTGMGTALRTKVRNCVFEGNSAASRGGAIAVDHGGAAIRRCLFIGNSTSLAGEDWLGGGAMHLNWVDERYLRTDISRCTFVGNSTGGRGAAVMGWNSVVQTFLTQCIVAFHEDDALAVDSTPLIDGLTFFVMYGNTGGNIDPGYSTILVGDPLFCDYYSDDYTLCEDSPALPANNVWTVLMGYASQGCSAPCSSPVEETSWGRIKALYAPRMLLHPPQ